ncbi:HIRAN domain-containing protein [Acinetobacter variabilis]|uniref:HIRAN domain-containing protein n=1 Tax=Acinetobacter variabilis TaxID=70346 RepID=UPI0021D08775|nr:HIRAN domain-containing protein [Acinetobacter variabilis]MCU4630560.1 HIRAN domain-containing protein [Acinetobacter variabilis]
MEIVIAVIVGVIIWYVLKAKKAASETSINPNPNNISYAYNIVGEQSYQNNLKKIAGPKEEESKFFECYAKVSSEPFNQYDKNAVKVEINGLLVGYLSRGEAAKLAGKAVNKTVPAVIDGGWKDEESTGSYGVKLAINNVNDLV